MITVENIKTLLKEKLENSDIFLVDISIKPTNRIFVEIDSPTGVNISDCVSFSRQIEGNLDRETEDFDLQISSPGLDKPFKVEQQFLKYFEKKVELTLTDNSKIVGILKDYNEKEITLEILPSLKKQKENPSPDIKIIIMDGVNSVKAYFEF